MASIGCDGTTPAMYKVGKDIKAGTYTITPDGSGKSYYAYYKKFNGCHKLRENR